MNTHRSVRYRGEFRNRGSKEVWRPFYGSVRLDGVKFRMDEICADQELMVEAIRHWDEAGRYEWRIVQRTTTWSETVVAQEVTT